MGPPRAVNDVAARARSTPASILIAIGILPCTSSDASRRQLRFEGSEPGHDFRHEQYCHVRWRIRSARLRGAGRSPNLDQIFVRECSRGADRQPGVAARTAGEEERRLITSCYWFLSTMTGSTAAARRAGK